MLIRGLFPLNLNTGGTVVFGRHNSDHPSVISWQQIQDVPKKKRLLFAIVPLIPAGLVEVYKALHSGFTPDLILSAAVFLLLGPLFAVWWDRRIHGVTWSQKN